MGKSIVVDTQKKQTLDVILGQRIYVRENIIAEKEIRSRYTLDIFSEKNCGKCANRPLRPNDLCDPCPHYHGRYRFDRGYHHRASDTRYHGLPINDIIHVKQRLLDHPDFEQLQISNQIKRFETTYDLKFTGRLYGENETDARGNPRANQQAIVRQWLKTKVGVIKAPPRTGKTVLAVYLSCKLGVKTVVMAHQYKLLKQFYDTYMGNPEKGLVALSNAPELEAHYGRGKVVFLVTNSKQLLKFGDNLADWPDVLLINYQKFPHKLARVTQFLNNHYSFKVVDECHQGAAEAYARTLFAMTMPYSLGLSATPRRKDELDRKTEFTIGSVVAESQTVSIAPIVEVKMVETIPDTDYQFWPFAARWARNSEERNLELLRETFADLRAGHQVIIIPVGSLAVQKTLVDMINRRIRQLRHSHNPRRRRFWRTHPYPLAIAFNGKSKQDAVIDRVDDGRPCVLVAIQSMIKQGIDMQMPSMIYLNEPFSATAAVGSPMFEQLSYRVATPSPRKPMDPVIKIWVDNLSSFRGALTGLFFNEILPKSKPDATASGPKYRLGDNTYAILSSLKGQKRKARGGGAFHKSKKAPTGGRWGG